MRIEQRETDLLIVGSGFAGLWAAISARQAGVKRVTIVDKAIEKKGAKYYISAGGRSMGNHPDRALVRKFLGTTERVHGKRPRGNCSISGKVVLSWFSVKRKRGLPG